MPTEIHHQPRKRARFALVLAAMLAGLLLAVPAADAATYCVGSPDGCSGIAKAGDGAGLQEALEEASANGESDLVRIGAGTYVPTEPGGFDVVSPADGIVIRGNGWDQTIREGAGPSSVTLNVTGATGDSSKVRNVELRLSDDGGTPIGPLIAGAGTSAVTVTAPAGLTAGLGVRMGWNSLVESTRVITPGLQAGETIGDATVAGSLIAGDVGLVSNTGTLGIYNSRIEGKHAGIIGSVPTEIRDTLVHLGGGDGTEIGVVARSTMTATHLTVASRGNSGMGVRAYRHGGGSASLTLANSTVTGFAHDVSAGADPPEPRQRLDELLELRQHGRFAGRRNQRGQRQSRRRPRLRQSGPGRLPPSPRLTSDRHGRRHRLAGRDRPRRGPARGGRGRDGGPQSRPRRPSSTSAVRPWR